MTSSTHSTSSTEAPGKRLGALLVGVICAFFLFRWWNQSLSPMCAGDLFSMIAPDHGWLPYRDYYYQSPPGNILLLGWMKSLFGTKLIVPWAFHSVLNVASAIGLYFVLLRIAPPTGALLGTLLAFVFGFGDMGDTPSWYFHQIAAYAIFALLCFLRAYEAPPRNKYLLWIYAGGAWMGWAFTVKQTMAPVVVAFFVPPVIMYCRRPALRKWAAYSLASYLGGLLTVIGPVVAWLVGHGILANCLDQAFLRGASSKGPLPTVLMRPIVGLFDYHEHHIPTAMALAALTLMSVVVWRARKSAAPPLYHSPQNMVIFGVGSLIVMELGRLAAYEFIDLREPALMMAGISSLGSFALAAYATGRLFRDNSPSVFIRWTIIFVIAAHTYGSTLGWAMGEVATYPGLGLIMAAFWAAVSQSRRSRTLHSIALACGLCAITYGTWRKTAYPSTLFWWREPALVESRVEPRIPELEGFLLSESTTKMYEEITRLIRLHMRPGDELFSYPNMQVFYALAGAKSPTLCLNHWFDICTDQVAIEDARLLRARPPAMIISMMLPAYAYKAHEAFFRQGKPSGQRVIRATLKELVKEYDLVAEFPQSEVPMKVWVRKR